MGTVAIAAFVLCMCMGTTQHGQSDRTVSEVRVDVDVEDGNAERLC
jgi:hypothetical protein